jgi:hypothetical protein
MRASTAMGERAGRRGGRGGPDDAGGRGWEAAAREEGLVKGTPVPAMPAGRTAGFSPAERLDAAQRLEPAVFSPAEQAADLMTWHSIYEERDDKSFMGVSSP